MEDQRESGRFGGSAVRTDELRRIVDESNNQGCYSRTLVARTILHRSYDRLC